MQSYFCFVPYICLLQAFFPVILITNILQDVWAYRAVGIPISRIFTINHRGELKHELTQTFQSSWVFNYDTVVITHDFQLFLDRHEDILAFAYFNE